MVVEPNSRPRAIAKLPTTTALSELLAPEPLNFNPRPRNVKQLIRISTTFSTIKTRLTSFSEWTYTQITPQQLAQYGFYHLRHHQPGPVVCCFTCESEHGINKDRPYTTEALLALHHDDCLWTIALRDLHPCPIDATPSPQPTRDIQTPTPTAPQDRSRSKGRPPKNDTYIPDPQTKKHDLPRPSILPRSPSCPPANTRASDNPWAERTKQPSATATKSQPPFPTTATSNTENATYASVLKSDTRSNARKQPARRKNPLFKPHSQSSPNTDQPKRQQPPPPQPLTMKDLFDRFHNRPSPFKRTYATERHYKNDQHQRPATAAKLLSNFLISALPLFSHFLLNAQGDKHNPHHLSLLS
jgi:hypothetical protein